MRNLQAYYYLNNNILTISNARATKAGGAVVNGATGTAELLDKDGQSITNGGPYPLTYIPASQGQYECTFPPTITTLVPGQFVKVEILLDGGPSLIYRGILNAKVVE